MKYLYWLLISLCLGCSDASERLEKHAEKGDADAQFSLGMKFYLGTDTTVNYAQALKWWQLAAAQNYAPAECNIGVLYATGRGVPRDYQKAYTWWQRAADNGDYAAIYNLGWMYYHGKGIPKDIQKAEQLLVCASKADGEVARKALTLLKTIRPRNVTACPSPQNTTTP